MKERFVLQVFLLVVGVLSQVAAEPEERATFPAFRLEGQVQVQVDDGSLGTGRPNAGRPVRNGIGVFPSESRISPRRLRLKPRVEFTDSLTLYNQLDFDPDGFQQEDLELTVLDLYLSYQFAEGHELLIGQTKVPFGFENLRSSERLLAMLTMLRSSSRCPLAVAPCRRKSRISRSV